MTNRLRFDLPTILRLAEHASAAPAHVDTDDQPTTTPALLFIADQWGGDHAHIASNGRPSPDDRGSRHGYTLVAEPTGLRRMHWMAWMDTHVHQPYLIHALALDSEEHCLLNLLRTGHAARFDTFLLEVTDHALTPAIARRHRRPPTHGAEA